MEEHGTPPKGEGGLILEPVSKYRKEVYSRWLKEKNKNGKEDKSNSREVSRYSLEEMQDMLDDIPQIPYEERQFEDSHLTKFLHEQLILMKLSLNLLALISIMLSLMQSFFTVSEEGRAMILGIHSLVSVCMVGLVFLKYWKSLELREKQLIRCKRENKYLKCLRSVWFQVLLVSVHPNLVTQFVVLQVEEPIYGESTPLELNTIFEIVMLCRIYLLYNALISNSIYCTTRANRMCRIYNTKNEDSFGAKSVFNAYPLHSLLILFLSMVVVFSQMLSLSEKIDPNFANFENVVWCIIITMGTIGYGDYYPTSYFGRAIAFAAAISGIIMASLLILTLSEYLTMSSRESKSHITLRRLELRKLLQKYAEETVLETSNLGLSSGKGAIESLKKRTQRVKLTMRRLKNMVDTDNLNEQISNLFESLYANLMQIYLQQKKYASFLTQLKEEQGDKIQEINFTFAGQIQNIIKDR